MFLHIKLIFSSINNEWVKIKPFAYHYILLIIFLFKFNDNFEKEINRFRLLIETHIFIRHINSYGSIFLIVSVSIINNNNSNNKFKQIENDDTLSKGKFGHRWKSSATTNTFVFFFSSSFRNRYKSISKYWIISWN